MLLSVLDSSEMTATAAGGRGREHGQSNSFDSAAIRAHERHEIQGRRDVGAPQPQRRARGLADEGTMTDAVVPGRKILKQEGDVQMWQEDVVNPRRDHGRLIHYFVG